MHEPSRVRPMQRPGDTDREAEKFFDLHWRGEARCKRHPPGIVQHEHFLTAKRRETKGSDREVRVEKIAESQLTLEARQASDGGRLLTRRAHQDEATIARGPVLIPGAPQREVAVDVQCL